MRAGLVDSDSVETEALAPLAVYGWTPGYFWDMAPLRDQDPIEYQLMEAIKVVGFRLEAGLQQVRVRGIFQDMYDESDSEYEETDSEAQELRCIRTLWVPWERFFEIYNVRHAAANAHVPSLTELARAFAEQVAREEARTRAASPSAASPSAASPSRSVSSSPRAPGSAPARLAGPRVAGAASSMYRTSSPRGVSSNAWRSSRHHSGR